MSFGKKENDMDSSILYFQYSKYCQKISKKKTKVPKWAISFSFATGQSDWEDEANAQGYDGLLKILPKNCCKRK